MCITCHMLIASGKYVLSKERDIDVGETVTEQEYSSRGKKNINRLCEMPKDC